MAVGVNARTAFSLLFPPILNEFGFGPRRDRQRVSFGFLVSAFVVADEVGRLMDRRGPLIVVEIGVVDDGRGAAARDPRPEPRGSFT